MRPCICGHDNPHTLINSWCNEPDCDCDLYIERCPDDCYEEHD